MTEKKQIKNRLKGKTFHLIFAVVFVIMCLIPLLAMPFGPGGGDAEKRVLAKLPELIDEGGLNPEFASQFDTFFSENFGLRSNYITAYAKIAYLLTGDSVNEKVIAGKDGWLFYYETLNDFTGAKVLSETELNCLCRNLYLQNEYLAGNGIKFIFMAAPNKNSLYGEFMPAGYAGGTGESSLEKLEKLLKENDFPYISLLSSLRISKAEEQLYHKKDTHWNNYGAMSAVKSLLGVIKSIVPGYEFDDYSNLKFKTEYSWQGDLDTMLFPASHEKDLQYKFEIPPEFRFTKPMRTYEDILIETESDANDTRIFMFRDSFANAMIPFISNAFGKASYSRSIPYDYTLVEKSEPDVVVLEIAERNLGDILLQAPYMAAPLRDLFAVDYEISRDIKADIKMKNAGIYTQFSGNIEAFTPGKELFEIYIGLVNDSSRYFYEAFPVIGEDRGNTGTGVPTLSLGYSAYLDTVDLKPGEYEMQLLIKSGENFIRPDLGSVLHYSVPGE